MSIITQEERSENLYQEVKLESITDMFCKKYKIGTNFKKANAYKAKGIAIILLFNYLLQLVFTKKSMYMNIATKTHD